MTVTAPDGAAIAASRTAAVEGWIARVLRVGTLLSVGFLAIGVVLMSLVGWSPLDATWPALDLGRIPGDLLALRPEGFLWLGLLATLSTPLLRVAASIVGFLGAGERRMAGLGTGVLVIIALAVVVAQSSAA